LLRAAPTAARALADRFERSLLARTWRPRTRELKRRSAAACLALLPASASTRGVASGGADDEEVVITANAGGAITDAYAVLALRLVALAHDTLDVAFAAVVEPTESDALRVEPTAVGVNRALLGELPEESGATADALALRFAALCDALSLLFRVEPPSDVPSRRRLPLRATVALALRVLAVGSVITRSVRVRRGLNQLDNVPLLARQDVAAALPSLHVTALDLLAVLVQAVGTRMLSYVDVVGEATLTALARSATPRASVAANAAMSVDAIAAGTGATDGAEFYNEEAAKAALLHAPTRPLAYALAGRLLQLGGAGLDDRTFLAPLLAHATCDVRPLAEETVSADNGAPSKKRKRAKRAAATADAAEAAQAKASIDISLRDLVSEQARRAAMRVLHDALLHAPLALTNAVKRACAQAVIDVVARDMLAPQVQQSVVTNENTASAIVSRARAEAASMRLILVQTLDVVLRRVPAAAAVSTEFLRRLAQDPTEAVSAAARAALLREVHIESAIIKVAEAALSVSAVHVDTEEMKNDDDDDDDDDEDDDDDDDNDDENVVDANNADDDDDDDDDVVQQVADDFDEQAPVESEYVRNGDAVVARAVDDEAPYEEPAADDEVEPTEIVAVATMTTTTTTTTTTVAVVDKDDDDDDGDVEVEPILKRNRTETTTAVTHTYKRNEDDDSDSISLPDIVVASPDEADLL
jgi:hypothetical protein